MADAQIKTKMCARCKRVLPLTEENYVPSTRSLDGFGCRCKRCLARVEELKHKEKDEKEDVSSVHSSGGFNTYTFGDTLLSSNRDILTEIADIVSLKDRKTQLKIAILLEEFKDSLSSQ